MVSIFNLCWHKKRQTTSPAQLQKTITSALGKNICGGLSPLGHPSPNGRYAEGDFVLRASAIDVL
jgi:hypothetical protein